MMFQTKIRKVGNSSVVTLTAEMLAALDAKEGDTVYVTHSDDNGLKLQPSRLPRMSWMRTAPFFRPSRE
jgi:putative addiction module antidote